MIQRKHFWQSDLLLLANLSSGGPIICYSLQTKAPGGLLKCITQYQAIHFTSKRIRCFWECRINLPHPDINSFVNHGGTRAEHKNPFKSTCCNIYYSRSSVIRARGLGQALPLKDNVSSLGHKSGVSWPSFFGRCEWLPDTIGRDLFALTHRSTLPSRREAQY